MICSSSPVSTEEVADHYDELDPFYREIWGEHVHHGLWESGEETIEEAVVNLVRYAVKEGTHRAWGARLRCRVRLRSYSSTSCLGMRRNGFGANDFAQLSTDRAISQQAVLAIRITSWETGWKTSCHRLRSTSFSPSRALNTCRIKRGFLHRRIACCVQADRW